MSSIGLCKQLHPKPCCPEYKGQLKAVMASDGSHMAGSLTVVTHPHSHLLGFQ